MGLHAYAHLATRPSLFALAQRLAGLGSRLVSPASPWMKLPAFTGWGYSKDFPRPAARPFRARWQEIQQVETVPFKPYPRIQGTQPGSESQGNITPEAARPDLVARFTNELRALGGHAAMTPAADLPDKVIALLQKHKVKRVQAWDHVPGLDPDALRHAGIQVKHEAQASLRAGITGALAGIAETGTLVIPGGEGQPLSASLLPEIHIAVLRASDLLPSLEAALQIPEVTNSPGTVLVCGPSRTADIEMTLTIGVHGPGELHVFLLA
jgi:L-lactate dehydrogenase complex protein LldG